MYTCIEVNWVDEIPDFESSILRASVYLQIRPAKGLSRVENITNLKSFGYLDDSIVKNSEVIWDRYHVKEK